MATSKTLVVSLIGIFSFVMGIILILLGGGFLFQEVESNLLAFLGIILIEIGFLIMIRRFWKFLDSLAPWFFRR